MYSKWEVDRELVEAFRLDQSPHELVITDAEQLGEHRSQRERPLVDTVKVSRHKLLTELRPG